LTRPPVVVWYAPGFPEGEDWTHAAAGGALVGRIIGKNTKGTVLGALVGGAIGTGYEDKQDGKDKLVQCTMAFNMKSWPAFFKAARGQGTITCNNGKTANVRLKAKGGGITFAKFTIIQAR